MKAAAMSCGADQAGLPPGNLIELKSRFYIVWPVQWLTA
jgi:hypothetical protein